MHKKIVNEIPNLKYYASFDDGSTKRVLGNLGNEYMDLSSSLDTTLQIISNSMASYFIEGVDVDNLSPIANNYTYQWFNNESNQTIEYASNQEIDTLWTITTNGNFADTASLIINSFYCCSDTVISDTTTYFISNIEFEAQTPKIYLETIDSLTTESGICDSIINYYSKYIYNPNHCTDTIGCNLNSENLAYYYPFNGNAKDYGFSQKDGTVNGAILTSDKDGNENSAYYFDGIDDYISIPDSLAITNDFTISFWAYAENTNGSSNIICDGSSAYGGNDFLLNFNGDKLGIRADKSGAPLNYEYLSPPELTNLGMLNEWVHVTWAMNPSYSKIFLNGEEISQIDITGTNLGYHNQESIIGARNVWSSTDNHFKGKLDEIQIYNKELNANQIKSLYLGIPLIETYYDTIRMEVFDTTYLTVQDTIRTEVVDTLYTTITNYISVTDTLIIDAILIGIGDQTETNTIKIYPNPATTHIHINYGDFYKMRNYRLLITDSRAKIVYETSIYEQENYIDLEDWEGAGLYIVYLIDDKGNTIATKKILIQ